MTTKNSDVRSQVLAADESRYQALYQQDVAELGRMLVDDDYVHIHANGKIDDKAAFLASIEAARYRFINAERTEQQVRLAGPLVLLHGRTRTTLDVAGETKVMDNAFTTVWKQTEDGLKLLHWQATKRI
ncbi:ketosteroid isomerase-like protein [Variovorax boronicumulans]|uniref:Ketosteroid isomerase-like protein n=1 Tax=Variovorax boronicumulans TaxID=436515 RepID=A0AAW8D6N5_9BURK|nr:nuclear transport factor 2 family protein [Variovorax boronicumulans]MDP9894920.1 ketosteroid isomerase-like protein [Variovorax boronicumulans]MDQ0054760.1 ketosteroid isomerase-like protein [Variovorax boronicumulans]